MENHEDGCVPDANDSADVKSESRKGAAPCLLFLAIFSFVLLREQ